MRRCGPALVILGGLLVASANTASAQPTYSDKQKRWLKALSCRANHDCGPVAHNAPRKRNFKFQVVPRTPGEIKKRLDQHKLPNIEEEITFAFNSARLLSPARSLLIDIGQVLIHPKLTRYRFAIIGHTDEKGSAAYNLGLSERRARSARDFLINRFSIPRRRFVAIGRGEEALKHPDAPYSGRNRRVQFVNLGAAGSD